MPKQLALIGCTDTNLALAEAALSCGFEVVTCFDETGKRARLAARQLGARVTDSIRPEKNIDAVITGLDGDTPDEAAVVSTRGRRAAIPYDAFEFQAPLSAMVRQAQSGAAGKTGFIRARHTGGRDSLGPALRALLNALLQTAPGPQLIFAQMADAGRRASQLLATLTLRDGAIAQLNLSEQRAAPPRLELEIIGTDGLLSVDTDDEVLRVRTYDDSPGDPFAERRMREYWRLVAEALDDENHPIRVDRPRARDVQRIVKRIEKSAARLQPLRIKEPKT